MHERSALIFCASLASPVAQATRKTQCQHVPPLVRASRRVNKAYTTSPCSFGTLSSFSFAPDSPLGFFDPSFSSRDADAILRDLRKKAYALGPTPISFIDHQQPPSSEFNRCICCTCNLSPLGQNHPPNHQQILKQQRQGPLRSRFAIRSDFWMSFSLARHRRLPP